jgi:hypothetical protein
MATAAQSTNELGAKLAELTVEGNGPASDVDAGEEAAASAQHAATE